MKITLSQLDRKQKDLASLFIVSSSMILYTYMLIIGLRIEVIYTTGVFLAGFFLTGIYLTLKIFKKHNLLIEIFILSYVLPFTLFHLLLWNEGVIFLNLIFVLGCVLFAFLSRNLIYVGPFLVGALYLSYLHFSILSKKIELQGNIQISLLVAIVMVMIVSFLEFSRQKIFAEKISTQEMLTGAIAHELRTPLSSIKNFNLVLKRNYMLLIASRDQESRDAIDIKTTHLIEKSIKSIDKIVNECFFTIDLLLENLGNKNSSLQDVVNVESLIDEAIESYPEETLILLIEKNIKTNFFINCNKIALKFVLYNLFKNALQAIAEKGRGRIYLESFETPDFNCLHIKDTATGLRAVDANLIFEPFYTNKLSGTGIGLSFCRKVMQNLKGDISCVVKEGEYTNFILKFKKKDII